jgi:hypothetical protein
VAKNLAITSVVMPDQFTSSVVQVNGVSFNYNNLKVLDGLRNIMLACKNLVDVGFELSVTVVFIVFISVLAAITLRGRA